MTIQNLLFVALWLHHQDTGSASHSLFEITLGSWISLITSVSWLSLHRTRRARPKEPSPITFCTEYFSMWLLHQSQGEATTSKNIQYQHEGETALLWEYSVSLRSILITKFSQLMIKNATEALARHSCYHFNFLVAVWRQHDTYVLRTVAARWGQIAMTETVDLV